MGTLKKYLKKTLFKGNFIVIYVKISIWFVKKEFFFVARID